MDEQTGSENSSENITKDKSRDSGDGNARDASAAESTEKKAAGGASQSETRDDRITIAPEELPTMQWSDVYAELAKFEGLDDESDSQPASSPQETRPSSHTGPLEGLEDAMNWLEQLAAGQGIPIDEMPTLVSTQPDTDEPSQVTQELVEEESPDEEIVITALELDSDPMAWLEQLAVDQSSPLEELPSVADRLLASDIVSQTEIPPNSSINDPYDIDEALNYLERIAVSKGIDLSGVAFETDQPVDLLDAALATVDSLAASGLAASSVDINADAQASDAAAEEPVAEPQMPAAEVDSSEAASENADPGSEAAEERLSDLTAEMPDDPLLALDWLGGFGDEAEEQPLEVVSEADTIVPSQQAPAQDSSAASPEQGQDNQADEESQLDVDALDQMPDDPDEAMAWMEQMAKRASDGSDERDDGSLSAEKQSPSAVEAPLLEEVETPVAAQSGSDAGDVEETLRLLQKVLDNEGPSTKLVEELQNAAERHPDSPGLLRLLGDAYMQMGEVDKAITTYRRGFDHL